MTYNKPFLSGGVSRCVHCGADKKRNPGKPESGPVIRPRTIRAGCAVHGQHQFATEAVQHGWSDAA